MPKVWSDYALYSARRAHPIVDCRSIGDGVMRTLPLLPLRWQTKTLAARVVLNAAVGTLIEVRARFAFRKSWTQQQNADSERRYTDF
jgi:hypothetical protein